MTSGKHQRNPRAYAQRGNTVHRGRGVVKGREEKNLNRGIVDGGERELG